jgi:hypothetical protein
MSALTQKATQTLFEHDPGQNTGIFLWGPPGSGKSGSVARKLTEMPDSIYFINIDVIVESIIGIWFTDILTGIKQDRVSEQEKEDCYWMIRKMRFSALKSRDKWVLREILQHIPGLPASEDSFTELEWNSFKQTSSNTETVVNSAVSFLIFLGKHRNRDFILETTGTNFNAMRARHVFGDVHSVLMVAFVSSVDVLYQRVAHRKEQLLNAPRESIQWSYNRSYYSSLQLALHSFVFDEITIVSTNNNINLLSQPTGQTKWHSPTP